MSNRPIIVVITPVRNEAWVLDAFLTCTSSWADRIIVADQHSTDGSREIALKYDKVTLIDNDSLEMNQAAARMRLFQEVDKINGDKIVLALDADEFLSADFEKTEGWNRIMNSKPNEIFCFRWLNLYGDYKHIVPDNGYMEWGCHFPQSLSLLNSYSSCENRAVHEMRIPCLQSPEIVYIQVPDIRFVHLARLNLIRQKNKEDFYQVSSVAKLQKKLSGVSLFRVYNRIYPVDCLETEASLYNVGDSVDARCLIRNGDVGQYYIDEMIDIFNRDGLKNYLKLDIWNNPYLKANGINQKLPLRYRLLHLYLRKTQMHSEKTIVKVVDKMLKLLC